MSTSIQPQVAEGSIGLATSVEKAVSRNPESTKVSDQTLLTAGSNENLISLLYEKWFLKSNYAVSTSQISGAIIATIPVHPDSCNDYVTYINKMFNAWTGGLYVRCRFASTALHGGLIRIAQIPPNISTTSISQMTIQNLMAYPNVELNPQTTGWAQLEFVDEKNVLWHRGAYDASDPNTFAGYIVVFVVSPLITGSDGADSVNIVFETRGNFAWMQASTSFSSITSGVGASVFPSWALTGINFLACDLPLASSTSDTYLEIQPVSYASFARGIYLIGQVGTADPYSYGGTALPTDTQAFRDAYLAGSVSITCNAAVKMGNYSSSNHPAVWTSAGTVSISPSYSPNCVQYRDSTGDPHTANHFRATNSDTPPFPVIMGYSDETAVTAYNDIDGGFYLSGSDGLDPNGLGGLITNMVISESVILWRNAAEKNYSVQSFQIAKLFNDATISYPKLSSDRSHVFIMRDANSGVPLMYVRLCPNGFFTTKAVATATPISAESPIDLEYYGTIPMSAPLPNSTQVMRSVMREFFVPRRATWSANRKSWQNYFNEYVSNMA